MTPTFHRDTPTPELLALYNEVTGKTVKKGSYTRAKLFEKLEALVDENPDPVDEVAPTGACPLCEGDPANQTSCGEEGTFLGDSVNHCHGCDQTYNRFTGEPVEIGTPKKRRILNPQVKIDEKVELCRKEGIEIFYSKPDRLWVFADNTDGNQFLSMKSRQFAEYSAKELAIHAAKKLK